MKKMTIILLLTLSIVSCSYGQFIGIDFSSAKNAYSETEIEDEVLLKFDDYYVINYAQTPVGLKHCIEKLSIIMADNDFTVDGAYRNDILLASYVDDLLDYGGLCTSAKVGSSEVFLGWRRNGWLVQLTITQKVFGLLFVKHD